MNAVLPSNEVWFTGLGRREKVPRWATEQYHARWADFDQLQGPGTKPQVTVVRTGDVAKFESGRKRFEPVFRSFFSELSQVTVVIAFAQVEPPEPIRLASALRNLHVPIDCLEVSFGEGHLKAAVCEAFAKHLLLRERQVENEPERERDPLAGARKVITATKGLRAPSGRLSAQAVADRFGLKLTQLAKVLGKTKQAVSKTPDASSLQPGLWQFERVARLCAVLPDDEFRAWLNQPNKHLDGDPPIQLMKGGEAEVVADLAEGMLTGAPL